MARNKLNDLRDHLFETLEMLKDPDAPLPIERAKAICDVSQVIINTAKVEVEMVKAINASAPASGFFGNVDEERPRLKQGETGY